MKTIDSGTWRWTRSTLTHDQVKHWSKPKVRVYSDSVLCRWKVSSQAEAKTRWSSQVEEFQMYYVVDEFHGIDGEAIEFEWNILPRIYYHIADSLQQIQDNLQSENIETEQFPDKIIFMSMFNDIDWAKRNIGETCASNSEKVKSYAQKFSARSLTFIGLG